MYNKRKHLNLILVSVAICGFPGAAAWAKSVSVPSGLSVNSPSAVLEVDGGERDANTETDIKAWLDTPDRNQGAYAPITGILRTEGSYTSADGSIADIGFQKTGSDALSDDAGDTRRQHSETIDPAKSWHSEMKQDNSQDRRQIWDHDADGKPDADKWLEGKNGRHYCPTPGVTAVPLPGSLLFFGSGLLGLAATLRSGRRT